MFCRKCGEENPDNAVFCRNCGEKLKEEEVKKSVVIEEVPNTHQETTTSNTSKDKGNDWLSCCICIVVIFIVFGIFGSIFHL